MVWLSQYIKWLESTQSIHKMTRVNKMTEVNKMTWVNLFIYSCHLILLIDSGHVVYWLESCHLLAQVMPFIDFSHAIYWLESFYLLTRVILFIGLSHFIYWLESFYFWSAALRIRNGSPPAYNAIHSCAWGKLFRHTKSGVRAIFGSATGSGKNRVHNTITTAVWISQQPMLQSRIGQKEMILWGVIYHRERCKKLNWFCIAGCEMIVMVVA